MGFVLADGRSPSILFTFETEAQVTRFIGGLTEFAIADEEFRVAATGVVFTPEIDGPRLVAEIRSGSVDDACRLFSAVEPRATGLTAAIIVLAESSTG